MKSNSLRLKIPVVIALGAIVVASVVLYKNVFTPTQIEQSIITTTSKPAEATSTTSNVGIYGDIKEKDFALFASSTIDKQCPFYVPDGATYRECLSDWVTKIQSKASDEEITEVNNYCQTFTSKYEKDSSLAWSELYMKCVIFTFEK